MRTGTSGCFTSPVMGMAPASQLERHTATRYFSAAQDGVDFKRNDDGTATITGIRVFKEGTFRDSWGIQNTWTPEHLEQMVFHFKMLRDSGVFVDVPWKEDHSFSVSKVVGYVIDLRHEGEFLVADVEITEPAAADKWERGTFRARSAEIGMYETNDEALYYPVFMGCAFVTIGAVEGLYSNPNEPGAKPVVAIDQEVNMSGSGDPGTQTPPEGENGGENAGANGQPDGGAPTPGTEGGDTGAGATPPATTTTTTTTTTTEDGAGANAGGGEGTPPAPATPPAEGTQEHGRSQFSMRFGDEVVTDPVEAQRRIDAFAAFQRETQDANRRAYVASLASENKIAATQVQSLSEHALSLNDVQYAAFKAAYDAAPAIPLFGQFGRTDGEGAGNGTTPDDEIAVLEEQIAMHRRSGTPEDQIKELASFKRLETLRAAKA